MKIIKIISEYKRKYNVWQGSERRRILPKEGFKRVMAIVENNGLLCTKHIDIRK